MLALLEDSDDRIHTSEKSQKKNLRSMSSHNPLLLDRTEDKVTDADEDAEEAADVADLPQKNDNIALITTSACTVAKEDIS